MDVHAVRHLSIDDDLNNGSNNGIGLISEDDFGISLPSEETEATSEFPTATNCLAFRPGLKSYRLMEDWCHGNEVGEGVRHR